MWEEVASGDPIEFVSGLEAYDKLVPEGSWAMLRLNLTLPVTEGVAQTIEDALVAAGVPDVSVKTASPVLKIYFKKGFPWLPVIVGVIVPLLIVLAITVVSWQLFKEVGPTNATLLILLAVGAVAFAGSYLLMQNMKQREGG